MYTISIWSLPLIWKLSGDVLVFIICSYNLCQHQSSWNEPYWYKWIINLMTKLHNDLTCKHKYCWKCWNLPVNCWEMSEVLLIDTKRICFYSIMTDHFVHFINRIRLEHYRTSLGINYFNIKFTSCVSIYIITKEKKQIWTFLSSIIERLSFPIAEDFNLVTSCIRVFS